MILKLTEATVSFVVCDADGCGATGPLVRECMATVDGSRIILNEHPTGVAEAVRLADAAGWITGGPQQLCVACAKQMTRSDAN